MRSLALASRRKLHRHQQEEDSQRSEELMSFGELVLIFKLRSFVSEAL